MSFSIQRETHGQVFERTSLLNVGKGRLEFLQLLVDLCLRLLGTGNLEGVVRGWEGTQYYETYSFSLESFDGLDVSVNIICHGLEFVQQLLSVIYNSLVFQNRTVVGEVNRRGL